METSWFLGGRLCFSNTGPAHICNIKRTDAVGLHRLIDKKEERCQEGQQQQLHPRERAAAHRLRRASRRRCCKHGPGGGRGVGGGGTRHAGEAVGEAVLHVRGGFGGVWREQQALLPQLTGSHWAFGGSFDGSPTGGAAGRSTFLTLRPCCHDASS